MKYLKTYKIFETSHEEIMNVHYGVELIDQCDSIIEDIKDMLLELQDSGLDVTVGYTPMTLTYQEKTPKIWIQVSGEIELFDNNIADINTSFDRIKDYVKPFGFVTGQGVWERYEYKIYQMLIQK
jgi:hypothetical protein